MRTMRGLNSAIVRALTAMRRAPGDTVWIVLAIAFAFLLVGLVHLAGRNLQGMTGQFGGAQMIAYLDDGIPAGRAEEIAAALARLPAVEQLTYVDKQAAFDRLRDTLGQGSRQDDLVGELEVGVVPASIELTFAAGIRDVAAVHPLIERLEATRGIHSLEFTGEWVDRLAALHSGVRRAGWLLLAIVGLGCVYFVAMAIGSRVRSRRREAEISTLCGASRMFIRLPLLIEGIVQGVAGAALAMVGLWLLYRFSAPRVADTLARAFDEAPALVFLPPEHMACLAACGALLGLFGALLAVRHHEMA
ncbi:MAG: permease-like cell division protein FtsX [Proteobacteria bacterium]|nr:permease-like cell division protein FtsX [Pseudomonadota bacterium]